MGRRIALLAFAALSACHACDDDPAPASPPPSATTAPPPTSAPPPASAVDAGRPPLPTPPRADAARRRTLLAEGRALERSGDHVAAIAKYEEALAIAPGDASVLAELGWAQFHAGQLEDALASSDDAYRRASTDRVRAMTLYNMGRIAEEAEEPGAALSFYRRSFALRTNDAVRARILALGVPALVPGEVPVEQWVRPTLASAGPFATLAAACAALGATEQGGSDDVWDFGAPPVCHPEIRHAATGVRGVLEAGTITITNRDVADDTVHVLVARTTAGWFVVAEVGSDYDGPTAGNRGTCAIVSVEIRDGGPDGDQVLVARTRRDTAWAEFCAGGTDDTTEMRVCGALGASGLGCWIVATIERQSTSGTWRDGEGYAGEMSAEEADETCAGSEDDPPAEHSELGRAVEAAAPADALPDETLAITLAADGTVTFAGDDPPPALAHPVPLTRIPCLAPRPDPAFGCE